MSFAEFSEDGGTVCMKFTRGCEDSKDISQFLGGLAGFLNSERFEEDPFWLVVDASGVGIAEAISFCGDFAQSLTTFMKEYDSLFRKCTRGACVVIPDNPLLLSIAGVLKGFAPDTKPCKFVTSTGEIRGCIEELESSND